MLARLCYDKNVIIKNNFCDKSGSAKQTKDKVDLTFSN